MLPLSWPADYRRGLSHIKVAIEAGLAEAGAKISSSSVFLAKKRFHESAMPPSMEIAAVPFDAPRIMVEFTQQEILHCCAGVKRKDIREKIRRYPVAYSKFRNSPERSARLFSSLLKRGNAKRRAA